MTTPHDPYATPPEGTPASSSAAPSGSGEPSRYGDAGGAPQGTSNGTGTAALVLGILGLLTSWLVFGGLLGLVAIVLGAIGLSKVRKHEASNKGSAIAGIVLGVLSILVAGALLALGAAFFSSDQGQEFAECVQEAAGDRAAEEQCRRQFEDSLTS